MKKVAIYCRTSTTMQQNGLESQKRALLEFCKSKNIHDFIIYEDFGVSGVKSSRPELDRLMCDIRENKISTLIVYSFSRFARSTKFLLDSLEEFNKKEVNFISLSENVDLSTAIGKAMFTIISAIAALERDLISERVKNGMKNAKAKGKQIGREKLRPTEAIIALRSKGYTYKQISKMLKVSEGTVGNAIRDSLHSYKLK